MKNYQRQVFEVKPEFDVELLMAMSQERKLDGGMVEFLGERWGKWLNRLHVVRLSDGEEGYLLIWLDAEIEDEVQLVWDSSQFKGFMLHNLAQAMVMAVARGLVPDLVETGCAPMPRPEEGLIKAIGELGLEWSKKTGGLSRMYAILTPHPFVGGCEACFLRKGCPNLRQTGERS